MMPPWLLFKDSADALVKSESVQEAFQLIDREIVSTTLRLTESCILWSVLEIDCACSLQGSLAYDTLGMDYQTCIYILRVTAGCGDAKRMNCCAYTKGKRSKRNYLLQL